MKIILLSYISRSGSTYLSSEIDKSPEILSCPEAECLFDTFLLRPEMHLRSNKICKIKHRILSDPKFSVWKMDQEIRTAINFNQTCFQIFYQILDFYRHKNKPAATKVLFKAESLFQVLHEQKWSKILWEKCDIIYLIRDIRAIFSSQNTTVVPETGRIMSRNIFKTCYYWNSFLEKVDNKNKKGICLIHYESFIDNYPESLKELALYLHINLIIFRPGSELYDRIPESHKRIHENILLPPVKLKIHAWKNSLSERIIRQLQHISSRYILKAGYTLEKYSNKAGIAIYLSLLYQYIEYILYRFVKRVGTFKNKILNASVYTKILF
jgi:hypothetical protein